MLSDDLRQQVMRLEEKEKLQLVQLLIEDLKLVGTVYEIYTPFGAEAAARVLQKQLDDSQVADQPEIER